MDESKAEKGQSAAAGESCEEEHHVQGERGDEQPRDQEHRAQILLARSKVAQKAHLHWRKLEIASVLFVGFKYHRISLMQP